MAVKFWSVSRLVVTLTKSVVLLTNEKKTFSIHYFHPNKFDYTPCFTPLSQY